MSAHTPGPWSTNDTYSHPDSDGYIYIEVRGYPVAMVSNAIRRAGANARLIAAAPELLEALKAARDYVERAYDCAFPDAAANDQLLREIDAAIAKATGAEVSA